LAQGFVGQVTPAGDEAKAWQLLEPSPSLADVLAAPRP
jgi:hypothetical protein